MPDRVMVYIDGSNLYHSLRDEAGRTDLSFERFCRKLVGARQLVRSYYYNASVDQTRERQRYQSQQRFFDFMRRVPYLELRLGRLIYQNWPAGTPYEKGVDVKIATDMLTAAASGNYDIAILVSGDSDFADALQAVKDMGKNVEVALFGTNTSRRLRDVADAIITIDDAFLDDCWL